MAAVTALTGGQPGGPSLRGAGATRQRAARTSSPEPNDPLPRAAALPHLSCDVKATVSSSAIWSRWPRGATLSRTTAHVTLHDLETDEDQLPQNLGA